MDGSTPTESPNFPPRPIAEGEQVYFVPYRWLKEEDVEREKGVLYTATSSSSSYVVGPIKIINNIFNSDLVFNLRREGEDAEWIEKSEEGVSGRDFALVLEEVWLQTLKWHSNSNVATRNGGSSSVAEDGMADVYPLQLRLSVMREANQLSLRISKRDNAVEFYKRACKIFSAESEPIRIWDFSGQTNLYFVGERNNISKDCQRQSDQEILLELQVYGLSDSVKCRTEGSKMTMSSCSGSHMNNGSTGTVLTNCTALSGNFGMGLIGLQNLGNTCFMNSAIQCLVHTDMLVEYFLGDYSREINQQNPLGMGGELALAFGELLRKLWAPGRAPVAPRSFKTTLGCFAPQFSGFNQHDSQELLAFLLDGLHEDLNRVKHKPYLEAKDAHGRSDEEVADEYWENHLARNDSIIVDVCQGQYRSTLVCPVCNKVSVTFDPFMYLSLPLPSTTMRTMTVTIFNTDGNMLPSSYTITVPKNGKCRDLIQALSIACSLRTDENLLVAEVYSNRIIRYLEEPSDSISLIRDDDRLAAYRLSNNLEKLPLVVFMHQRMEEHYISGKMTSSWKAFGIPLVTRLGNITNGSDIHKLFLNLLNPFQRPGEASLDDQDNSMNSAAVEGIVMDDATSPHISGGENSTEEPMDKSHFENKVEFFLTDEKGITKDYKVEMNEPFTIKGSCRRLHVLVCWQDKTIKQYDIPPLISLPEIFKSGYPKKPQELISLYACLEAFLREEPLGPEDMWYCPCCKMHRQASKKLDLWRLPEILVIHLKRFSYSRFMKNKLEAFVDFPIRDLDLSNYIPCKNGQSLNCYELYALSNHYGGMGGGHYTAYVNHKRGNQWHEFDDSNVFPITVDKIKTSAAYVLFYRRVGASDPST
ncbi:ubiquitin carboxyl-terminal hydrolase 8-like isoform X1 [Magnolia sinica]|uniref:ubiquitin carboxyl-terminal hydrolase 8-like isoform X1 n=1 Tax=Magnolia sinica TaxID=86752 RepID=UPI002659E84C|nr:ubiquitin carboxyl-terminal hydrolase 8-like isoform X1 [Magnolia sinica]